MEFEKEISLYAHLNSKHIFSLLATTFWLSFAETISFCFLSFNFKIKYGRLESILSTAYI